MGVNSNAYFDSNPLNTGVCPATATGINPGAPPAGRYGSFHTAGAPTNGAAGSFFGVAPKYALLTRDDTGVIHMNTGTLASPTWTIITGTP